MSPAAPSLATIIGAARRSVQRDTLIATITAVVSVVPAVLVLTWLLGGWRSPSPAPLVIDLLAVVAAAGLFVFAVRRWLRAVNDRNVAAAAESQLGFAAGELQGVLELRDSVPVGTSQALWQRSERRLAERLTGETPELLAGNLGAGARRRSRRLLVAGGGLAALATALGLASPERSRASWSPLLSPVATLTPPPLPALQIEPGNANVTRGSDVAIRIHALQRSAVELSWRARGDVLHTETLPVVAGRAESKIANVDAQIRYWVSAPDGAQSDTFRLTPVDPLLISALSVDVVYPAYLNRPLERFETDVPPLEVPAGTQLRLRGRATRTLQSAALRHEDGSRVELATTGATFNVLWVPRASGRYEWQLVGKSGEQSPALPQPLDITVIADAAPEIEITYPGVDTLMSPDMKQVIVADARDDHALISATLVSWRSSALGERFPAIEEPLPLEGDVDRKLVRGLLDAVARGLLPGDTLSYFVRVVDNSPMRQSTDSRTYTLRVPGMEEMRERAQSEAEALINDAGSLARAMKQLETRTRDLQRKSVSGGARQGQTGTGGSPADAQRQQLSHEQAEQAKQVLERQREMTADVERLRERLEAMERAAERAGLRDPELQQRLSELRELYDQLLSPELKQQMEELQRALEKLDPEEVQKALEQLAKQQEQFREQLERSLDLMRRAAAEQEMNALAQQAKELATQQQAVADEMKSKDGDQKQTAEKQEELAKRGNQLAEAIAKLQRKLSEQGENTAAGKTGEAKTQAEEAESEMKDAAQQASQRKGDEASQSGEQAAGKLNEAAETLDAARAQMSANWRKETQEAVDQATQDAISLAQAQKELLDRMQASASAQMGNPPKQQSGQQQSQQPGQNQGSQQQGGKQGSQSKDDGQQQGGAAGQRGAGQKQGGNDQSGRSGTGQGQPGGTQGEMQQMRADQAALKQGLEQLGKNLSEAGQRSAMVNKDVGSALARANLNMDQTMRALEQASQQDMPTQEAEQTVNALNRLALELLKNGQQIEQAQSGTGLEQALQQLAELAKQQGNLNGRSNSLLPLNLAPQVLAQQLGQLARDQRDIAQKLGGMNKGGARDDLLGRLDELVKEADQVAREIEGGRLTPETLARQEKLFHRLLDAGRVMEREEISEERQAQAARPLPPSVVRALKPGLFDSTNKYALPTPEQLRDLPPAYRRLILEYFQRLNSGAETGQRVRENR